MTALCTLDWQPPADLSGSDLNAAAPTKVCQQAVGGDGAAEVLLQVVRPVEEGLQLLRKAFVASLGLELNQTSFTASVSAQCMISTVIKTLLHH